jgi:archaellum component FlaG (FlaF/FlaG flagellin family)
MANVLGILTFIVLGLAAFVAYKNKELYQAEITVTGGKKEKEAAFELGRNPDPSKQGELDELRKTEKGNLGYNEGRLALAKATLDATFAKRTGVDEENVNLATTEAAQKKTNAGLESEKSEKTAKTASNKEKLDEIREKTSKVGNIQELASKMRQTKADLEELAQSIAANEAKLANLTAMNVQTEASADGMKKNFEIFNSVQSLPTLNTRIRSIYPTWGFVTLASGNNAGVVTNSTLDVVRDGTVIAKLLVSSVEGSSASASIVPDSLAQDVTLMVGDKVVASAKAEQPEKN